MTEVAHQRRREVCSQGCQSGNPKFLTVDSNLPVFVDFAEIGLVFIASGQSTMPKLVLRPPAEVNKSDWLISLIRFEYLVKSSSFPPRWPQH